MIWFSFAPTVFSLPVGSQLGMYVGIDVMMDV